MSTPTSRAVLAVALVALSACEAGLGVTRNAPAEVRLPDGMVIAGARGWCVDRSTTRARNEAAVVVFGSCAALSRNALLPQPPVPGIVTVSVEKAAGDVPPSDALAAFFETPEGRAAIARDGRPDSVEIVETRQAGDALLMHAVDRSGWPRDAAEDYWRAIFDIDGRFVTVSLVPLSDRPIPAGRGLAALEAQIRRLKRANGL